MSNSTLLSATTSIFEELALLLAAPDGEPAASDATGDTAAGAGEPLAGGVRVAFTGPRHGAVTVHVTAGVLHAVAANMLGRDLPHDDALCRDALGELANVLCGTFLPTLAGRRAEFRLAPPEWLGAAGGAIGLPAAAAALALEGGRAEVRLYVVDGAGGPPGAPHA